MELRFRLGETEVSFNFWFFAIVALVLFLNQGALTLYLALPVIVHESGHLLAMACCGLRPGAVRFTAISVNIRRRDSRVYSYSQEVAVILGGVAANLLFALGLYLFFFQSLRAMFLIAANLAVAAFNILPIGNLDGGTLCRLLCDRFFSPRLALNISRGVSFFVLTPLFALSILLMLRGGGNFTLLLTCIYLTATVIFRG